MLSKLFSLPWPPQFFYPRCPCCITCGGCTGDVPRSWSFTISGVTDATCTDCDNYNGTFQVDFLNDTGTTCLWETTERGVCTDPVTTKERWRFLINTSGKMQINVFTGNGFSADTWRKTGGPFDCLTSHVLSNDGQGTMPCDTFPSTITISPV